MDVESLAKQLILQGMTPEQQKAVLESIRSTMAKSRELKKQKIGEQAQLVVQALKKIEADIKSRYDEVGNKIEARVASIKDGKDGRDGTNGRDGRAGRDGSTGPMGPKGADGRNGADGRDGTDGISVTDARIDFDGSLIIALSSGREINVGEVVAPDLAEKIKVITNGGGTSQSVLDTLASLQNQINNLIPSQTGNAGKFLTTNGSVLSWADIAGGLDYQGTWNASTNTPTLASGVGTNGYYYVVSVDGSTNLDGITDWKAGDWAIFNGTTWQKIDQSWAVAGANDNITSMTGITGGISSPDFIQFDTGATVTNAAGRMYWDATQQTMTVGLNANIAADIGQTLYAYVTNDEAVTINKGQPVYMYAASGDRVSVKLAYNTGDATSAKTLGVCAENIAAGQAGMVLCQGVQDGLNLSAYSPGDTLYLGATAGTLTNVKPYAPNHLVYIGVVERANAGNGRLYVRVQNGYELDELHNVSAQNPTNGQTLIYNESTSLWEKHTLTDGNGISISNGAGSITVTNSAPDQTVSLTGAGTTSISGTYPSFTITSNDQYVGTVTSVGGTGTVNGISLSGTVTSSGNLTLGGTLSGVDLTTQVTGTLPIANGGTGQTTANAAFNALAPSQTSNSGKYLTTDGSNTSWATVNAGASLSNDTSTSTNLYPLFAAATSGTPTTLYTSNAQYLFKPSTGELSVKAPRASNGILVNSQTISADYTIASGDNGGSFGPVSVASGITVTVSSGSTWTVV
jgi:Collagen triple helix repeat (20 copies)